MLNVRRIHSTFATSNKGLAETQITRSRGGRISSTDRRATLAWCLLWALQQIGNLLLPGSFDPFSIMLDGRCPSQLDSIKKKSRGRT